MARLTHPPRPWRGAVLLVAGAYFLVPLLASFVFTVDVPGTGPHALLVHPDLRRRRLHRRAAAVARVSACARSRSRWS